jgi:hypothetical protein
VYPLNYFAAKTQPICFYVSLSFALTFTRYDSGNNIRQTVLPAKAGIQYGLDWMPDRVRHDIVPQALFPPHATKEQGENITACSESGH